MATFVMDFRFKPQRLNVINLMKSRLYYPQHQIETINMADMVWPDSVYILTSGWAKIDGPPGSDPDNWPQTVDGWIQNEFRAAKFQNIRVSQLQLQYKMVRYRFDTLMAEQAKRPHTYTSFDAYNAAWASLGYTEGQTPKVIELSDRRFKSSRNK